MRGISFCAVVCALAGTALCAQGTSPAKKKAPVNSVAPKKPAVSRPTSSAARPAVRTASRATASTRVVHRTTTPAPTWRARQTAPAPERYKEIQEALVAKGYLSPVDANGSWNTSSTEALKRFQSEQNLDSSGKINALSLIALGLGPRHDPAPVTSPAPQLAQEMAAAGRQ